VTKSITALLLLAAVSFAGPVADYLGVRLGRQAISIRYGRDSTHYFTGNPDAVSTWSSVDTTTVFAETTYQGHPAWLSSTVAYQYDSVVTVDTCYELGDTIMAGCQSLATLHWHTNRYRVPLTPGTWWRTGTAGTWYADLSGDGLIDTLRVWDDTVRVERTEDVRVPWGTVPGCSRLLHVDHEVVQFQDQGYPLVESLNTRLFEWYKDSLGWVKDSGGVTGALYYDFGALILAARFTSTSYGILDEYRPGLATQTPNPVLASPLSISPNPCRSGEAISLRLTADGPSRLDVFESSGRLTSSFVIPTSSFVTPPLPAGLYFLRLTSEGHSATAQLTIVK
jgi:hypothetical protein